jgi:dihydrodipicolinate reductase
MKVGVVGSGKLSQTLIRKLPLIDSNIQAYRVHDFSWIDINFCIHAGSGREWDKTIELCSTKSIPLIQSSTPANQTFPSDPKFIGVYAPNLCIGVLKFLRLSQLAKTLYPNAKISLVESHQKEKHTRAATAERLADMVGIDTEEIVHVRAPEKQLALGIQEEALNHHAYHELKLDDQGLELKLSCKSVGANAYAIGASSLVNYLNKAQLKPGIYHLEDLIEDSSFKTLLIPAEKLSC